MEKTTAAGANGTVTDRRDAVRHRAEEIYERNGKIAGRDRENWAQAEREIAQETAAAVGKRTAVVVKVDGILYVGEYSPSTSGSYRPGEIDGGSAIGVRFEGDALYLKRPNGEELRTTVVQIA